MRTLFAVSAVAFGLAVSAAAQNIGPLPPLTAQVDVHVVNVDVAVTDADGNPVLDLTRDDFEIVEDGQPQKVTNFAIFRNAAAQSVSASSENPRTPSENLRRRILLIVDNNYLQNTERNRALDVVERYLGQSFSGEWAVAAIGHTVELVQPFTADKSLVRAAIEKVRRMGSFATHHEIDRSILSDRTRKLLDIGTPYDYSETVRFKSREQTFRNLLTIQNTARAVVDTARAHAADDGKKFMILLTGGMELNTSFTAYDKPNDLEMRELRLEIVKVTDAIVREANAANFTIYVINARSRGMIAPQHDVENRSSGASISPLSLLHTSGNDPIDVADVDSIPLSTALGTGGMYLPSADLRRSIERIDTQTSNFYSLGYSPSHDGDRQYHRISVRVKRRGVRVANRLGYFDMTPEDRLEEMLRVRMTFDRGIGSLPVTVRLGAPSQTGRDMVVPVTTAMPLQRITLLPQDDRYIGRVHVYVSIFDDSGRNVGFHHQTQEVNLKAGDLPDVAEGSFRYTMRVHLQKGSFTVVVTLKDELSNEMGSASQGVTL